MLSIHLRIPLQIVLSTAHAPRPGCDRTPLVRGGMRVFGRQIARTDPVRQSIRRIRFHIAIVKSGDTIALTKKPLHRITPNRPASGTGGGTTRGWFGPTRFQPLHLGRLRVRIGSEAQISITGAGFVALAGVYTSRGIVGPSSAVRWIAICLRIARPSSAGVAASSTSKHIPFGAAGLRPYSCCFKQPVDLWPPQLVPGLRIADVDVT